VSKLNFGIIGCGRIAYKHAEAIKKNEKANLLSVCDVIEERVADYKDKYGAQKGYIDYHELLENPAKRQTIEIKPRLKPRNAPQAKTRKKIPSTKFIYIPS
jgi:UDP-N-acetyl-2-amino-2-deoxyglucuronate dehydrogenase